MKRRVIFFGTHEIAIPLLGYLSSSDLVDLRGIVSKPERMSGRGRQPSHNAVNQFAVRHRVPLLTPMVPDGDTVKWIQEAGCDIIFVMAYGHILKKNILELPELGIYNFHGSILPKYRGAAPIEAAISCGDKVTGVTLMVMVEAMDAGDILDIGRVDVTDDDNYCDVMMKLAKITPELLEKNLSSICTGRATLTRQDAEQATFCRKISKDDGILDFSCGSEAIRNRIRALTPHIGAFADFRGELIKIGKATTVMSDCSKFSPGEIISVTCDGIAVATGDGILMLHELQRPNRKMLSCKDFINGFPLSPGDVFSSHTWEPLHSYHRHKKQ